MLKQRNFLFAAILYTVFLTIFSLIQVEEINQELPTISDKFYHFLAYFLLVIIWSFALSKQLKANFCKSILIISIASLLFGIVIEVLQQTLTSYRQAEYLDILANSLGILFASMVLLILYYKRFKKS